ncbi:MAG: endonuclease [Flavobacteriales bacterium]
MKTQHIIGFYNTENLFDTVDNPETMDDNFTAHSPKKWTKERYENKLHKLAKAISSIGDGIPPVLLGLAEIENETVLKDLTQKTTLQDYSYGIVHFDSPDERGIDVGLIYQKKHFKVLHAKTHAVYLQDERGIQDTTRDILHVSGLLEKKPLDIIVTHWPSRRNNDLNAQKRLIVADKVRAIVDSILDQKPDSNLLVMGDFNDDPNGKSLKRLNIEEDAHKVQSKTLFNPMIKLKKQGKGSLAYKGCWYLFDQILMSKALVNGEHHILFNKAAVFNSHLLQEWEKPYKGQPFRTYVGKKYLGGYSDHFPVYIIVNIND